MRLSGGPPTELKALTTRARAKRTRRNSPQLIPPEWEDIIGGRQITAGGRERISPE
jgi:hypothetical protein